MKRVFWLGLAVVACGTKTQTPGVSAIVGIGKQKTDTQVALPSGRTLNITEAKVTVHSVALELCPSAAQRIGHWLLPSAWAHAETTAPHLEGPFELDALHPSDEVWGKLTPPAGTYCHVTVIVSAEAPTRHGDEAHTAALHVDAVDAADATQTFDFAVTQEVEIENNVSFTLSASRPSGRIDLSLDLVKLLTGVDVLEEGARPAKLAENLHEALVVAADVAYP